MMFTMVVPVAMTLTSVFCMFDTAWRLEVSRKCTVWDMGLLPLRMKPDCKRGADVNAFVGPCFVFHNKQPSV